MEEEQKVQEFVQYGKYQAIPFHKGGLIGQGSFGKVFRGIDPDSKQTIALKIISKSMISKDYHHKSFFQRELESYKNIKGRNILHYIDLFECEDNFVTVTEFCSDGDLGMKIEDQPGGLSEDQVLNYLRDFLEGYKILLENNIIHRNIKPQNLLIHDGVLKIGDYGLSEFMISNLPLKTTLGTRRYIYTAPEVLLKKPYDNLCDIWSLGITMHEALLGTAPWDSVEDLEELKQEIFRTSETPLTLSAKSQFKLDELIGSMLQIDPQRRITWEQLFNHPLFKSRFTSSPNLNIIDPKLPEEESKIDLLSLNTPSLKRKIIIIAESMGDNSEYANLNYKPDESDLNSKSRGIQILHDSSQKQKTRILNEEHLSERDLQELLEKERIKKSYKENQLLVQNYMKVVRYILYSVERCKAIFKQNNIDSDTKNYFYKNFNLDQLQLVFLKLAIIILDSLDGLNTKNLIGIQRSEMFVQSDEYKNEKPKIIKLQNTVKAYLKEFQQQISEDQKKKLHACLLSEDICGTSEFLTYLDEFENELVSVASASFKNAGKILSTDVLTVIEITMNILDWQGVYFQKDIGIMEVEKLMEILNAENLENIRNRIEAKRKRLTSPKK